MNNDGAALAAAKASDDKNDADAKFSEAFSHWLQSAYFHGGGETKVLRDLKPLMGNAPPSVFVLQKVRTRIERMQRLDTHVRGQAHLTGDLARLDALRDATAALEAAVTVWEAALDAHTATSAACAQATGAFDRAYGFVVRSIRRLDPKGAAKLLPTWSRAPKPRKSAATPE